MIIPSKFNGYNKDGTRNLFMGGGGGGPTQTTSTVQNTNIPEYAKGYVENMLGATQQQLFQGTRGPDITNPETGAVTQGDFNITGFKPYQAYGGSYDAQGNAILGPDGKPIYDASKAVAGFSPLQQQAQQGIAGMQMPGQFGAGSDLAVQAGLGGMRSAQDAMRFGQQGQQSGLMGQQLGTQGGAQYGGMGAGYGVQGANLGVQGGAQYGRIGAGYGQQAAGLANTALGYGNRASSIGEMALQAQDTGNQIGTQAQNYAAQAAGAGQQYANQATDPYAMQQYMSPYMQNVVDVQNREAQRQAGIAGTQQQAEATKAGAFGGGRDAIMRAERERNLGTLMNQNQAQGLQSAYQQAQQAQQFGAGLGLQGLAGAQQGLGTALQGGQLGLSGLGTALQGQQGALAGVGAANQAYQTGIQGAGMGLQGVNTQLAGTAQGMQGAQIGLQGVDRQLAGTAQGMQGAQTGLQGVQGAQAGYGLANQAGSNLANIGSQQQAAQLGIYGAQNQAGAQQQALEQAKINQSMLDYANAQQYPLMQLGTMSNMLRGLPMQASTTNQYAASPNPLSQVIGTAGAGASIYNAMKPGPGGAAGGLPSEFKYSEGGGIMSYDMGGEVESQLENMDEKGLQAQARESSSPTIRKMAQRMLRERQMSKQPQSPDAANVQYQAAQPQMPSYKPGGIVAFTAGDRVYGGPSSEEGNEENSRIGMEERLAQAAPTSGGIMGATTQPTTPVPVAPAGPSPDVVKEAMRQRDLNTVQANRSTADVIKEIQAERDASGIGDNKAREEYRAQQMAERANMKDEQERQRNMRLAEFFASWGSTPGPVLVAGMNALKQSIPNLISDEKDAKKARKEADKIIYDIDEATRLDKLGMHNEATARREKAAKQAEEYNKYLLTFQSARESNKSAQEVANISAEAHRYSADVHAKSQGSANAQRAQEAAFYHVETNLNNAYKNLANVQQQIETVKQNPKSGYLAAQENINLYNTLLRQADGDVSKVPEKIKQNYGDAVKHIERFDTSVNTRLQEAKDRLKTADTMFQNYGRGAKDAKVGAAPTSAATGDNPLGLDLGSSTPAASAAPASTSTKASTSRAGDASSVNPYVDAKGKAKPDAPRGEPSKASKLADEVVPAVKNAANKVADTLSGSELRYLKDKIDRNEKLSVTDRIRAERAGLL